MHMYHFHSMKCPWVKATKYLQKFGMPIYDNENELGIPKRWHKFRDSHLSIHELEVKSSYVYKSVSNKM